MIIETWFSVPISYYDLNTQEFAKAQNEIETILPFIREMDLTNPWGDTVKTSFKYDSPIYDLMAHFQLNELRKIILLNATKFCDVYKIPINSCSLKIRDSWINISQKGGFQFDHTHVRNFLLKDGVFLSGVYYYQANPSDGNIIFKNPNEWNNIYMLGTNNVYYTPKVGRLIMFPSYLRHSVQINPNDSERISFSFNVFFEFQETSSDK